VLRERLAPSSELAADYVRLWRAGPGLATVLWLALRPPAPAAAAAPAQAGTRGAVAVGAGVGAGAGGTRGGAAGEGGGLDEVLLEGLLGARGGLLGLLSGVLGADDADLLLDFLLMTEAELHLALMAQHPAQSTAAATSACGATSICSSSNTLTTEQQLQPDRRGGFGEREVAGGALTRARERVAECLCELCEATAAGRSALPRTVHYHLVT